MVIPILKEKVNLAQLILASNRGNPSEGEWNLKFARQSKLGFHVIQRHGKLSLFLEEEKTNKGTR